jgi:nucleotide-binding universal stress UspA family protein
MGMVMLVSPPTNDADPRPAIVVGYDASDTARRALARAGEIGAAASQIVIVAVLADIGPPGFPHEASSGSLDAERALAEARESLGAAAGFTIETRIETGDPALVLVDVAREVDARLLIVGRRGGDFVARTLLGSVAQRVVQAAACDVLVVA